ncbi:hypothetical protein O181_056410 [Austropuccinia psidii MF-1]|uniref:Uncharacterized protein n=1 Tax=Austropuccinia psidii MF-1 TaxID=1389203 RepID=A0A9Q3ECM0_9BASI|nr:hypothetical protein [Austropuccinia psidii MF-1]
MMPSSNRWLVSFTVFRQGNNGSSFSRDIQEEVPKQFAKGQCSINPPWQTHSLNTVRIQKRPFFSIIHLGNGIQPSSFPNLARYTINQAVNTASRIQYRQAVSLKG